jgi:PKD repeat protein
MLPLRGRRLLLGFALAALAVSCEKQPLLAPTGSSITLTATSNALSANGSIPIVAQVIEASGFPPHSGTQITFITTLGQIQPAEAQTDVNGQVSATFFAGGQNGTATITAISGGVNTGTSGGLKIFVGTAAVGAVSIGANPLTLPASGGSSTVSALVLDINGNPLVGSPVAFTTTAGTLSTSLAPTNGNGIATTVLTTTAQATVTATVGAQAPTTPSTPSPTPSTTPSTNANGQASASVTINVQGAPTITIAPPTTPVQKNIPATFTITVTAASANGAPIKDVTVNWGDGQSQSLGAFTGALPAQHKYDSTGTFTVTATVTDVAGNSNSVSSPIVVTSVPGTAVNVNGSVALDGKTATFTITIAPPTGVGITGASIDYGDGRVDQLGAATSATKVHVYSANGTYPVTVTATDTVGRTTPGSTIVTITGAP